MIPENPEPEKPKRHPLKNDPMPPTLLGRLPSVERLHELTAGARVDLDRVDAMWAEVSEHKLRGGKPGQTIEIVDGRIATTGLPESTTGLDMSSHPSPETHADPTGEAVGSGDARTEGDDRHAQLVALDALARLNHHTRGVTDALVRLRRARVELGGRLPYADAVLNDAEWVGGNQDHAERLRGQIGQDGTVVGIGSKASTHSACIVCTHTFARITRGMCDADYRTWINHGRPDIATYIAERRPADITPESPYKPGAKEVR